MRRLTLRSWKPAAVLVVSSAAVAVWATASLPRPHAKAVRVAIMTDCKGAFAFGYEIDIGGAQAAFAQYAGGKTKNHEQAVGGHDRHQCRRHSDQDRRLRLRERHRAGRGHARRSA